MKLQKIESTKTNFITLFPKIKTPNVCLSGANSATAFPNHFVPKTMVSPKNYCLFVDFFFQKGLQRRIDGVPLNGE